MPLSPALTKIPERAGTADQVVIPARIENPMLTVRGSWAVVRMMKTAPTSAAKMRNAVRAEMGAMVKRRLPEEFLFFSFFQELYS